MNHRRPQTGILFVCLGNICRSPLAEGVFAHLAKDRGVGSLFMVDSCGTGGWHVGEPPDTRSIAVAHKNKIELVSLARMLEPSEDFERFDLIVPMDRQNRRDLLAEGAPPERVRLLRSFDPALTGAAEHALDVPDPYWDEEDGFDAVFAMIHAACLGLIDELVREHGRRQ